jgi:hypothetical protein
MDTLITNFFDNFFVGGTRIHYMLDSSSNELLRAFLVFLMCLIALLTVLQYGYTQKYYKKILRLVDWNIYTESECIKIREKLKEYYLVFADSEIDIMYLYYQKIEHDFTKILILIKTNDAMVEN